MSRAIHGAPKSVFRNTQLYWECNCCVACETFPLGLPDRVDVSSVSLDPAIDGARHQKGLGLPKAPDSRRFQPMEFYCEDILKRKSHSLKGQARCSIRLGSKHAKAHQISVSSRNVVRTPSVPAFVERRRISSGLYHHHAPRSIPPRAGLGLPCMATSRMHALCGMPITMRLFWRF